MRLRRPNLARIAVAVVWVVAIEAMTAAGGELVRITSPKDGQRATGLVRVQAQTELEDPSYLIFCVDGDRPRSTNSQPYVYELDTTSLPDGPHALAAEVYAREGLVGRSDPVTIIVANNGASGMPTAVAQASVPAATTPSAATEPSTPTASDRRSETVAPMLVFQPVAAPATPSARRHPVKTTAAPEPKVSPKLHVRGSAGPQPVVTIVLDGRTLSFDVKPAMYEGLAFGGLRRMIEQSGGSVDWLNMTKQAIAQRAQSRLQVTIGKAHATIDGRAINLGAVVRLTDGRTLVPVRATCGPMGYKVAWAGDVRTVDLCSKPGPIKVGALPTK